MSERRFSPVDGAPIPTGECTDTTTGVTGELLICELQAGHNGKHTNGRGTHWWYDTPDPVHTAARRLLAALTDKPSTDGMTELAAAITALRAALGKDAS